MRKGDPTVLLTQEDFDWALSQRVSQNPDPDGRRLLRRAYLNMGVPATLPAFGWPEWLEQRCSAIQIDELGHVWVMEYRRNEDSPREWSVFCVARSSQALDCDNPRRRLAGALRFSSPSVST